MHHCTRPSKKQVEVTMTANILLIRDDGLNAWPRDLKSEISAEDWKSVCAQIHTVITHLISVRVTYETSPYFSVNHYDLTWTEAKGAALQSESQDLFKSLKVKVRNISCLLVTCREGCYWPGGDWFRKDRCLRSAYPPVVAGLPPEASHTCSHPH